MSEEKKSSFANAAYAEAEKRLKDAHRAEFEGHLDAVYAEAGVERKRRLTAEERAKVKAEEKAAREALKAQAAREKALAAAQALAAEYPDLIQVAAVKDDPAA